MLVATIVCFTFCLPFIISLFTSFFHIFSFPYVSSGSNLHLYFFQSHTFLSFKCFSYFSFICCFHIYQLVMSSSFSIISLYTISIFFHFPKQSFALPCSPYPCTSFFPSSPPDQWWLEAMYFLMNVKLQGEWKMDEAPQFPGTVINAK